MNTGGVIQALLGERAALDQQVEQLRRRSREVAALSHGQGELSASVLDAAAGWYFRHLSHPLVDSKGPEFGPYDFSGCIGIERALL